MSRKLTDGTFKRVVLQAGNLDEEIPEAMKHEVKLASFKR